ncbi:MAG: argininosuccinate lyase [Mogibacterium sp.]|nr:argininosuccinate lyase [Mogibacterium sp.]
MDKLWAGRTIGTTADLVDEINSSIAVDRRLYRRDIDGSIAHAKMMAKQGILSQEDADLIIAGLKGICDDITSGALQIDPTAEDIHMYVEAVLTDRIGETGKKLHTARSRNDQVALDTKMYCREEIRSIRTLLRELMKVLCNKAEQNLEVIMPGYTHMQHAQPVSFGQHLMAYAMMFERDQSRLEDCLRRMDRAPIGACALAGTTFNIDRRYEAELLGFSDIMLNSMDAVSDRDHFLELLSDLAIIMMHTSRLSEEIIMWATTEFGFIQLPDEYTTGSSIMPQKKNPDVAELCRGKTGRVYGNLMSLLTTFKGIPLAYNKDMQEDKVPLFDSVETVKLCIEAFIEMVDVMIVNEKNMYESAKKGYINATDIADYLVTKGMPFRDAYNVSGRIVSYCLGRNVILEDLPLEEYLQFSPLFGADIHQRLQLKTCMEKRNSEGGTSPSSVRKQIEYIRAVCLQ